MALPFYILILYQFFTLCQPVPGPGNDIGEIVNQFLGDYEPHPVSHRDAKLRGTPPYPKIEIDFNIIKQHIDNIKLILDKHKLTWYNFNYQI